VDLAGATVWNDATPASSSTSTVTGGVGASSLSSSSSNPNSAKQPSKSKYLVNQLLSDELSELPCVVKPFHLPLDFKPRTTSASFSATTATTTTTSNKPSGGLLTDYLPTSPTTARRANEDVILTNETNSSILLTGLSPGVYMCLYLHQHPHTPNYTLVLSFFLSLPYSLLFTHSLYNKCIINENDI
jgi:hypothetical protein